MTGRLRYYTIGLFAGLLLIVAWSYQQYRSSYRVSRQAAQDLADCRRLVDDIQQIRSAPARAAMQSQSTDQLASRIEAAAAAATMPIDRLWRIEPQAARRLGETAYKEQPTLLELHEISLVQLVKFLYALNAASDSQLQVRTLRLLPPRRSSSIDAEETWSAEVTLTYLIFSPKTTLPNNPS